MPSNATTFYTLQCSAVSDAHGVVLLTAVELDDFTYEFENQVPGS